MPPASAAQGITSNQDREFGFSLLLGVDYEKKKQKLLQELQLDYKHHVAQKRDLRANDPCPQPQGLSLPIDERISAKEKLKEERKKEYNVFLQEKAHTRRLKRGTSPVTDKPQPVRIPATDAAIISPPSPASPPPGFNTYPRRKQRPASRRDAATLTEEVDHVKNTKTWDPGNRRHRRRWQIFRHKEPYSSEEEFTADIEEELELRHRRRKERRSPESEDEDERGVRGHRANRASQKMKEVEASGVHEQNNNDCIWKSESLQRMAATSRPATSKNTAAFATGLLIGATEEQTASRVRKELYKQELLKQIEEQQRNKIREKTLELKVAATGATDPEKKPNRIQQFGAVHRQHNHQRQDVPNKLRPDLDSNPRPQDNTPTQNTEKRVPPVKPQVDTSSSLQQTGNTVAAAVQGINSVGCFNEDYYRDLSDLLGEVTMPRTVAALPSLQPPSITDNYRTPYDAAYYYYGARNPLDHSPLHHHNDLPGRVQQTVNIQSPPQKPPPPPRPSHPPESVSIPKRNYSHGAADQERRESALSYQEALKQQIKEREERKRREKEEKERYEAKIEAEMMAYNPWGRSGAGAPIKDQKGNLFSNLDQMHRINEESVRNPVFRNSGQTNILMRMGDSVGAETGDPLSHQPSDFNKQQFHTNDKYKEDLKQQIEENRRRQAEERERAKAEEEKEERRLADQRARIQREYEEEQRKHKKIEYKPENQIQISEPKTLRQEEEKKKLRQEQDAEKKVPESRRGREEEMLLRYNKREPSPPVPALQKTLSNLTASRPSSVMTQLSARTERSVSAPHYRRAAVKTLQLDGHQDMIRELSACRRYLRKEQRQLELQLGQTEPQGRKYTPPSRTSRRPRVETFESAQKQTDQSSAAGANAAAAAAAASNAQMNNIREFIRLKYRDSASREDVLHMFPDPPTDAHSLDIQQQALLREQQRRLRLMKREEEEKEVDFLQQQLRRYPPMFMTVMKVKSRFSSRETLRPQQRIGTRATHRGDAVIVNTTSSTMRQTLRRRTETRTSHQSGGLMIMMMVMMVMRGMSCLCALLWRGVSPWRLLPRSLGCGPAAPANGNKELHRVKLASVSLLCPGGVKTQFGFKALKSSETRVCFSAGS